MEAIENILGAATWQKGRRAISRVNAGRSKKANQGLTTARKRVGKLFWEIVVTVSPLFSL